MSEIDAMDEAEYTEDSWAEFQTVVAEAKEFKEKRNRRDKTERDPSDDFHSGRSYGEAHLHS